MKPLDFGLEITLVETYFYSKVDWPRRKNQHSCWTRICAETWKSTFRLFSTKKSFWPTSKCRHLNDVWPNRSVRRNLSTFSVFIDFQLKGLNILVTFWLIWILASHAILQFEKFFNSFYNLYSFCSTTIKLSSNL